MSENAPGPLLLLGAGLCALAFSTTHPVVLVAVAVCAMMALAAAPPPRRGVLWIAGAMAAGVAALNPFVQASGDLIILQLPDVPIFDSQITLEELVAGAALGIRAAAVTIAIMAVLALADPDRLLRIVGRLAPRSAVIGSVAARMVPTLRRDATRLIETQRLRGRSPVAGRWSGRIRAAGALAVPLVGSSLERSLDVAEAMAARGYGSGRATRPPRAPWRRADRLVATAALIMVGAAVAVIAGAVGPYSYYPTMDAVMAPWPVGIGVAAAAVGAGVFGALRR